MQVWQHFITLLNDQVYQKFSVVKYYYSGISRTLIPIAASSLRWQIDVIPIEALFSLKILPNADTLLFVPLVRSWTVPNSLVNEMLSFLSHSATAD